MVFIMDMFLFLHRLVTFNEFLGNDIFFFTRTSTRLVTLDDSPWQRSLRHIKEKNIFCFSVEKLQFSKDHNKYILLGMV